MVDVQRMVMRASNAMITHGYRRSGGRLMGRVRGVPVLLLTVAGRKTGVEHTTAISYFEDDGRFVVTGSAGGAPTDPQWFRNLRRTDHAVIEVGRRRIDVTVAVAGPEEHAVLWARLLIGAPFFAKYQAKLDREIPMAVLTPTQ